jgi:hypothetical protein
VCLLLDSSPTFSSRPLMSKLVPSRGNVSCFYHKLRLDIMHPFDRWPITYLWIFLFAVYLEPFVDKKLSVTGNELFSGTRVLEHRRFWASFRSREMPTPMVDN